MESSPGCASRTLSPGASSVVARDRDADERREHGVSPPLAEQRPLEIRVRALERLVVPVEAAARLGRRDEQPEQDGAKERVLLARAGARMSSREDRGRRLSTELFDRKRHVVTHPEQRLPLLDERAHERPELVQRRPLSLGVLLEREREVGALLQLAPEHDERAEDESSEQRVEVRRAHGHDSRYGLTARVSCVACARPRT